MAKKPKKKDVKKTVKKNDTEISREERVTGKPPLEEREGEK